MAQTTIFDFTLLNGSDAAGHTTINNLINSIESSLASLSTGLADAGSNPGGLTTGRVLRWNGSTFAAALINDASLDTASVTETKIASGAVTSDKIANDTIVNADINSSAGIVDTKLATISTAGKVANSATTATNTNTASTIVARDASGNFSAGTITASLSGAATNLSGGAGGSIPYQSAVNTTAMLANGTAGQVLTSNGTTLAPSWQNASIGTANIADNSVTYAKLATDAKTYSVAFSGAGVYYTASGNSDLTTASLSTASTQNPLVITNGLSGTITLELPKTLGTAGATITICRLGTSPTVVRPKGASGTNGAFINGSTSTSYTLVGQFSLVTLVCIIGGPASEWIITGDYI